MNEILQTIIKNKQDIKNLSLKEEEDGWSSYSFAIRNLRFVMPINGVKWGKRYIFLYSPIKNNGSKQIAQTRYDDGANKDDNADLIKLEKYLMNRILKISNIVKLDDWRK